MACARLAARSLTDALRLDVFPIAAIERIFGLQMDIHPLANAVLWCWENIVRGPITDDELEKNDEELENDEAWRAPACETAVVRALLSGQLPQLFFRAVEALPADLAVLTARSLHAERVIASRGEGIPWDCELLSLMSGRADVDISWRPASERVCALCHATATRKCSACKVAWYCSHGCQRQDWRSGHREACRQLEDAVRLADAAREAHRVRPRAGTPRRHAQPPPRRHPREARPSRDSR